MPILLLGLATGALLLGGCAGSGEEGARTTLTVSAAASLTESFAEIGERFEDAYPDVEVVLSFGPSSSLVSQVVEGADVDVLATASAATMQAAVDAGVVKSPRTFAVNTLMIAVPATNPAQITTLADLARVDVLLAVCEERVPCGAAARQVIASSGLPITPATYEIDVKAVLSKVILDEVDAGMVYATDVIAAGDDVRAVVIPAEDAATVAYPIAVVESTALASAARAFVDFVRGSEGRRILAGYGFGAPA